MSYTPLNLPLRFNIDNRGHRITVQSTHHTPITFNLNERKPFEYAYPSIEGYKVDPELMPWVMATFLISPPRCPCSLRGDFLVTARYEASIPGIPHPVFVCGSDPRQCEYVVDLHRHYKDPRCLTEDQTATLEARRRRQCDEFRSHGADDASVRFLLQQADEILLKQDFWRRMRLHYPPFNAKASASHHAPGRAARQVNSRYRAQQPYPVRNEYSGVFANLLAPRPGALPVRSLDAGAMDMLRGYCLPTTQSRLSSSLPSISSPLVPPQPSSSPASSVASNLFTPVSHNPEASSPPSSPPPESHGAFLLRILSTDGMDARSFRAAFIECPHCEKVYMADGLCLPRHLESCAAFKSKGKAKENPIEVDAE